MKLAKFIFAAVLFSLPLMAAPKGPKLVSVNIIDQNGLTESISSKDRLEKFEKTNFLTPQPYQKVMRIYSRDENGNITALTTSYHQNGQPKQYLEIVNGRAYGNYYEWHSNGQVKIEAFVINGEPDLSETAEKTWLFDCLSKAYDEQGKKLADIHYSKGFLEGVSTYYHASGSVWKLYPYKQGALSGKAQIFLENGDLFSEETYENSEPSGPAIRYWNPSLAAAKEEWNQGFLVNGDYFDSDGSPITQVRNGFGKRVLFGKTSVSSIHEYKNGKQEGKVENYSPNGNLVSTHYIKEDMKHGEELLFYRGSLTPKLSINWYKGKIQGKVKTWYPDGVIESQKELSGNKKNGILTAWYPDGSLMIIEEYDQDKLVKGDYYALGKRGAVSRVLNGKGIATLYDSDGNFIKKITYNSGRPSE